MATHKTKSTTHKKPVTALDFAEQQLGVKYVFGAEQAGVAFDCSGLVQYAYGKAGVKLPRTAAQQQRATTEIGFKDARPGDLVFYGNPAHHVGIYLGNGEFLEAPHTGDVVKIAHIGTDVTFGRVGGVKGTAGSGVAANMASNPNTYVSYGFTQSLANSVPEIKNLLTKAAKGGWDVQRFQDALQTTAWWKKYSDTAKKMIEMQKADPAEYRQERINAEHHIEQIAGTMGVTLTTSQINAMADTDLFQGMDDTTLQTNIGALYKGLPSGPNAGGQSVALDSTIKQMAASYGLPVTQTWVNGMVRDAISKGNSTEAAQASLQAQAASMYTPIAAQIKEGQTVQQIAQPFMAQMAQLLELDPNTISLTDPTIQKALMGQLPSSGGTQAKVGQPATAPTSLNDFANSVRNDPRWAFTSNAKQSAASLLHGIGQDFGFAT